MCLLTLSLPCSAVIEANLRKNQGQLRIIGGQWKSRKLPILSSDGLRPTTDRIRETVFNWLQFDIRDAVVIDLFAGSGGLAFEAASRGARQVIMVEKDVQVARQLQRNAEALHADKMSLVHDDAFNFLRQQGSQHPATWDIVFVDPPFNRGLAEQALQDLARTPAVSVNTLVYIETETDFSLPLTGAWQLIKDKRHGAVKFCLIQKRDLS